MNTNAAPVSPEAPTAEAPSPQSAIIAVFDTHLQAERAVRSMKRAGFDMRKLSIVGKGYHTEEHPVGFYTTGDRVKTWGGIGAFWGGLWGLLIGAAFFWIPGIGPLAVAGPFVHLLVSALEGAILVGGVSALGAALVSLGVPREKVMKYETQVRADKYLLIAHGDAGQVEQARTIMSQNEATETAVFGG
jgi:hypothetical protein